MNIAIQRVRSALSQFYTIDRELGRGGMATVFLAQNPELAEANLARGIAVSLSKNMAEAEQEFERAMRLDSKLFEVRLLRAGKKRSDARQSRERSRSRAGKQSVDRS